MGIHHPSFDTRQPVFALLHVSMQDVPRWLLNNTDDQLLSNIISPTHGPHYTGGKKLS